MQIILSATKGFQKDNSDRSDAEKFILTAMYT
jgi:hypothetical protein